MGFYSVLYKHIAKINYDLTLSKSQFESFHKSF